MSTVAGDKLTIEWRHADVEMPILSTNRLSQGGKGLWYHEKGGSIVNPHQCTKSDIIEANGVNFIKLLVPKSMTQKGHPPPTCPPKCSGFVWPGA